MRRKDQKERAGKLKANNRRAPRDAARDMEESNKKILSMLQLGTQQVYV
jgi:hypothetical protein